MQGRLQEVDLGDEVRVRNAAMTEQARRRLAGETIDEESEGSRKRPRVGKDGKPWRGRKRRASDDVKRDQMVEALMRENRRECLTMRQIVLLGFRSLTCACSRYLRPATPGRNNCAAWDR